MSWGFFVPNKSAERILAQGVAGLNPSGVSYGHNNEATRTTGRHHMDATYICQICKGTVRVIDQPSHMDEHTAATVIDPIVFALQFNAARSAADQSLGDPGTPARRYAAPVDDDHRVGSLGDPGTPGRRY